MTLLGVLLYLLVVLPIDIYCGLDTSILVPHFDRKIYPFNTELLISLFRIIFSITSVASKEIFTVSISIFVFVFLFITLKQPILTYCFNFIKRALGSAVAYACIYRLFS